MWNLLRVLCSCLVFLSVAWAAPYKLGVGIYDMTGPSVQINFMGYAVPSQRGTGIHQRLRARAFYFGDEDKHVVFVSVDGGMGSDLVNMKVVEALNNHYGQGVFSIENICISGTHTHGGPAGFLQYALFQITSWGFVQETFDAWVSGITQAIIMAYDSAQPGYIKVNQGKLYDSNINRSPTSYLLNPEEERAEYPDGDTDKTMILLNLLNEKGEVFGVVNWFSVHGTSMNNTNTLVTGDNKGYASYTMEKAMNGPNSIPGMGPFVAGFASTNLGDVSPNTMGPKCIDTGLPCDGATSSCNGRCQNCIAFGPGKDGDMFESTQIIGNNQYEMAMKLMQSATEDISGPIDFRHTFVNMPSLEVQIDENTKTKLCSAAMGYSFAAGTTDGPGMMNFTQGITSGNPFWDRVRDFLSEPTEEEVACQAPKPILFNTGDLEQPYPWDPSTLPVQIFRIGNFFILAPPSEFTTMSGRRLRKAVESVIRSSGMIADDQPIYLTIAGLSNSYSSYVTTFEEFQAQRYEAASTIFGPNTLKGYIQEFSRIANDLMTGKESATDASPPDLSDVQISLHAPGVPFDRTPIGTRFGDVVEGKDAQASYSVGSTVSVKFHSANPRNNNRPQGTFLTVERKSQKGVNLWRTEAVDGDWATKYHWQSGKEDPIDLGIAAMSWSTVSWDIPEDATLGTYRICHHGAAKRPRRDGEFTIEEFTGCSSEFSVVA